MIKKRLMQIPFILLPLACVMLVASVMNEAEMEIFYSLPSSVIALLAFGSLFIADVMRFFVDLVFDFVANFSSKKKQ